MVYIFINSLYLFNFVDRNAPRLRGLSSGNFPLVCGVRSFEHITSSVFRRLSLLIQVSALNLAT